MANEIEFDLVDFANELGDAIRGERVLSSKIPRIYDQLKDHLVNSKLAVWNEELEGFDKI